MNEIPKRRFNFDPVDGFVDLYLDGRKVVTKHRGSTGNYYFRILEDAEVEFSVAEHDGNIPLEAEVTATGLKPIERRPKFVQNPPRQNAETEVKISLAAKLAAEARAKAAAAKEEKKPESEPAAPTE